MPRGLLNWTFDEVVRFLKNNNFSLNYVNSSHTTLASLIKNYVKFACLSTGLNLLNHER